MSTTQATGWVLTTLALVSMTGCTVGRDYVTPSMLLPAQFSVHAPNNPAPDAAVLWWQDFNDPVLNALVSQALLENVQLAQARKRVEEAAALALMPGPFIDVNGRIEAQVASNNLSNDRKLASATGFATLFGGRKFRIESARARVEQAMAERDAARLLLLSNVITTYIDLRYVQERLALKYLEQRSWRRAKREVDAVRGAGEATRLDALQPAAALAETDAAIANLLTEVARQRNRMATLLGTPAGLTRLDLDYKGSQPLPKLTLKLGVPGDLIRNRPDIRRAERGYRIAVAEIGTAEAARYPSLVLSGTISVRSDTDPVSGGIGAVGIDIPLFDQGAKAATVTARERQAEIAFLEWKSRVLIAVEEVETSLVALRNSRAALSASGRAVSLNSEAVDLARDLFSVQELSVLDFISLQRTLLNSQADRAQNRRQFATQYLALKIAVGAGSLVEE